MQRGLHRSKPGTKVHPGLSSRQAEVWGSQEPLTQLLPSLNRPSDQQVIPDFIKPPRCRHFKKKINFSKFSSSPPQRPHFINVSTTDFGYLSYLYQSVTKSVHMLIF